MPFKLGWFVICRVTPCVIFRVTPWVMFRVTALPEIFEPNELPLIVCVRTELGKRLLNEPLLIVRFEEELLNEPLLKDREL
ncbi:MAG: hypothetical protein KDA62_22295, partial [Planctomycetales bacterium]|nr:hypothetical protein [Planctomycetales bacterium]